jgi:small subunit ribosomal protein S4
MGRYLDPVCKLCRREQIRLYLKGERCFGSKCPIDRGHPPPGMHGMRRSKQSEYGERLRQKQRLKRFYGVLEAQFRRYFKLASRAVGNTGEQLLSIMERRLDNVVHRLGFAISRNAARQMITHGHILLNGRKCDKPSILLKPGDIIKVRPREISLKLAREGLQQTGQVGLRVPDFLELTGTNDAPEGRVIRLPTRQDVDERISDKINEQLIIEIVTR